VHAGFAYADCLTDDARLTITSARDAVSRGAEIVTRTEFAAARREGGGWHATLRRRDGGEREVAARVLVNTAGPWVLDVLARVGLVAKARLRLVKGSHIVVPRLYDGEHAYLLQNHDRRVVFVLPFERDFSLIGTTELPFTGDPAAVRISEAEIAYLCAAVGRWFRTVPRPADIVWSYAGVRPLYDDRARTAAAVTRDYVFEIDAEGPPVLSVFGGKLTTYRRLAEAALTRLARYLPPMGPAWTAGSVLPGGDEPPPDLKSRYPFLDAATAVRLAESYGTEARRILGDARCPEDLGRDFGHGLTEAELRWMIDREWARTAEDVLWRRSKLGLRLNPDHVRKVATFLERSDARQNRAVPANAGTRPSAC
jgi:glycerol-3-phosphate dehydrogenase